MAKGNLFLGKARGKVGDVVFSNLNGIQISRAYQPQVKNPKTTPQLVQRASFATVSLASSIMADIVDHSFDGIAEGPLNRQEFVRANMNLMRQRYNELGYDSLNTFILPKGAKYIKPYPYMVSRGSIGTFQPKDVKVIWHTSDEGLITIEDFRKEFPWLKNGSQLTSLVITYRQDANGNVFYKFYKSRLVFNDRFETWEGLTNTHQITGTIGKSASICADILDLEKCENVFIERDYVPIGDDEEYNFYTARFPWAKLSEALENVVFNDEYFGDDEYMVAQTLIGTQYDRTKADPWLHTTSYFAVDTDRWDDTNDNIASYGNAAKVASSNYYLDQATPSQELEPDFTLDQVISGEVKAAGLSAKTINLMSTNSYGPVAEGSQVTFSLFAPQGWKFNLPSAQIYNGETSLTAKWQKTTVANSSIIIFNGQMPTTTNFQANISVDVYNTAGDLVGTAALRCTVSKANA
ncbi:MAG: hypothetical protein IJ002_09155 [Clostridia bacterium]|nr:hypothetical protein [Clostridia bacterium]